MNEMEKVKLDKRDARIEELERRLKYCEEIARQYECMYKQLESKLKVLADREGNIQQVYDYMTRVGSELAIKTPHNTTRLNPIRKALPKDDKKYLEMMEKIKFKVGDEVFYADEHNNSCEKFIIKAIDVIDRHPRYILQDIFGYVDESKLFSTREQAQWQLDEWRRSRGNDKY